MDLSSKKLNQTDMFYKFYVYVKYICVYFNNSEVYLIKLEVGYNNLDDRF